jgi:hypothetical protein
MFTPLFSLWACFCFATRVRLVGKSTTLNGFVPVFKNKSVLFCVWQAEQSRSIFCLVEPLKRRIERSCFVFCLVGESFFWKNRTHDALISLFHYEWYACDNNDKIFLILIVWAYCDDSFEYYI